MSTVDGSLRRLAASVLLPGFEGTTAPDWLLRRVGDGLGGVVLFGRNVVNDEQVTALTASLRAARPGVVIGIDEEGGDVTRLDAGRGSDVPGSHALGAADDVDLTRAVAAAMGARLSACGITVDLAPSADLNLTLDDPVIGVRAFGSNPTAAARHVAAFVEGLQSSGVAACAKHFPGHGASAVDSHLALPVLPRTEDELRAVELVPFQAAVHAGVRSVMTGHLVVTAWGEQPATLNPRAVQVLREELGFTGAIITDALDMRAVAGTTGMADGAVRAIAAGVDALCVGGEPLDEAGVDWLVDALVEAVVSGELPESRLVEAAARMAALGVSPVGATGHDHSLGLHAARLAIQVRGDLRLPDAPLVLDLMVPPTIAVGDVPWGLGPYLTELLPGTTVLATRSITPEEVEAIAAGRPVVVVTRDAHRHAWARELVTGLARIGLDLVHVETGVPGPDLGTRARIDTHGGSRVSLRAAAERIAGAVASPVSGGTK
ncbi:glycoside hydrolase family 3 protein [Solihabitans fulvus]|uniref:Glycoside hydrolase family 3 protein n=1 Tax=Solihabitans fulvus TaxID=1892852 RepID=A0A5B2XGV1_9PSEU|nr:glycoside hydrolase family 3 N-terminal domain-containing protein [Solihabitans fulvus]KAA2262404.1 glycoside hydrolase family 3 protein [Solihabitans fulvus]